MAAAVTRPPPPPIGSQVDGDSLRWPLYTVTYAVATGTAALSQGLLPHRVEIKAVVVGPSLLVSAAMAGVQGDTEVAQVLVFVPDFVRLDVPATAGAHVVRRLPALTRTLRDDLATPLLVRAHRLAGLIYRATLDGLGPDLQVWTPPRTNRAG